MTSTEFLNRIDDRAEEIIARARKVYHYSSDDLREMTNPYDLANLMPDDLYDFAITADVDMISNTLADYMDDMDDDVLHGRDAMGFNIQ